MARLKQVTLDRLVRYYLRLEELRARTPPPRTITSARLGAALDIDASQVRKDLASIGLAGVSRVGYNVAEVRRVIRAALGFDRPYTAVLVGVGQLGGALLNYIGFDPLGLRIVAAFDGDPAKIGQQGGGLTIRSVHTLKAFIEENAPPLAIFTTPAEVAQGLAELVVAAGVRAIWNFTSARLRVPHGVLARNEYVPAGLAAIAHHLKT